MIQHFIEGIFIFENVLPVALICYLIIFAAAWLIGRRKPCAKLIPCYISEFVLTWYSCAILKITGILFTSRGFLPQFSEPFLKGTFEQLPFVGASFQMVALNFFLFVPLGFLLPLALRFKKHRSLKAILIAVLFSVLIESIQIFIGRFFEIDDIIANSLGAVSGTLLWQGIYWIKTKQIKKGILGIVSAFIVGSLFLAGVSYIANGDRLQEELLQKYTELPEDTELENNLAHIDISSGVDAKASAKTLIEDFDFASVYLEMQMEISTWISQYEPKQAADLKTGSDDILISVYLNEPQTFNFYNNPDITMENVVSWSYDINDGSIWYTDSSGNESLLSFVGRDDVFVRNEKLFGQANDLLDKYNQSKNQ